MNDSAVDTLRHKFREAGQEHVFAYFDKLDAVAKEHLYAQAASIDLEELRELVVDHVETHAHETAAPAEALEPAPYVKLPDNGGDASHWEAAFAAGTKAIAAGKVAAFTVAGGQGTRLGFDGPKGTFPVTPVSKKSLFQVFAEKLIRSGQRFGVTIPWFILTSEVNNRATVAAFEQSNFFGLNPDSVHFIIQGRMPAVDHAGRILMTDKATIAMSPDGHGGALRALVRSGAIAKMATMGIDCISYFQVDNPLVYCIDPAFIGFHLLGRSELSSRMVPKAYASEKVGVFCQQGERLNVVEYSDMAEAMQTACNPDGSLYYNAGNVAIHLFDREFIARIGGGDLNVKLPFHRADKKIPFLDEGGKHVDPETANGIKFELFVFDALPLAKHPLVVEAAREELFSPVKNAEGADSPETCRKDQLRMFVRWLRAAGKTVATDSSGLPEIDFEISPLFAVDEADFIAQWSLQGQKKTVSKGQVIE